MVNVCLIKKQLHMFFINKPFDDDVFVIEFLCKKAPNGPQLVVASGSEDWSKHQLIISKPCEPDVKTNKCIITQCEYLFKRITCSNMSIMNATACFEIYHKFTCAFVCFVFVEKRYVNVSNVYKYNKRELCSRSNRLRFKFIM